MKRRLIATATALAVGVSVFGSAVPAQAATYPVVAKAVWVNDTIRVTFTQVTTPGNGEDEAMQVIVAGKVVYDTIDLRRGEMRTFEMTRIGPGFVTVDVVGQNCFDTKCTPTTVYSEKVRQHVVTPKRGQISAATLLDELPVAAASHSGSYASSKFGSWIDANHDGENTRTEVLKAESKMATTNGTTGRWTSPYDGTTSTTASALEIDHLVPLKQAWVSGADKWTAKKRAAYANDLTYAPSLIAVSKQERRTKGSQSPATFLPPKESFRCTYIRDYIAVKYRWGLAVTPAEKAVLRIDLAVLCVNPYVTRPATPNLAQLTD